MTKLNNNNSIIMFRKFLLRKIHFIPQVFSSTKIPQNTPSENSTFCIPQSTPSLVVLYCGNGVLLFLVLVV